jgi:hypothetical protein
MSAFWLLAWGVPSSAVAQAGRDDSPSHTRTFAQPAVVRSETARQFSQASDADKQLSRSAALEPQASPPQVRRFTQSATPQPITETDPRREFAQTKSEEVGRDSPLQSSSRQSDARRDLGAFRNGTASHWLGEPKNVAALVTCFLMIVLGLGIFYYRSSRVEWGALSIQTLATVFFFPTLIILGIYINLSTDAVTTILGAFVGYLFSRDRTPPPPALVAPVEPPKPHPESPPPNTAQVRAS